MKKILKINLAPATATGATAQKQVDMEVGLGRGNMVTVSVPVQWDAEVKQWLVTKEGHELIDSVKSKKEVWETWEMTKAEFSDYFSKIPRGRSLFNQAFASRFANQEPEAAKNEIHKEIVQDALREGKPVPESVLADYPDLKLGSCGSNVIHRHNLAQGQGVRP